MIKRWRSWIRVQLHRTSNLHCLQFPTTVYMALPPIDRAPASMDELLASVRDRAGRATIDVYACGGCRFGHP